MTVHVKKTSLATDSALQGFIQPGDFVDCYGVRSDLDPRTAAEIITEFPVWARALTRLRNLMVRPFGLLRGGPPSGDRIGMFPVVAERPDEIIAGFDDSHLNFRISILTRDGMVYLATWVHRNTPGGRIYLALILPFHVLIVRNALRRVARHPGTGTSGAASLKTQ